MQKLRRTALGATLAAAMAMSPMGRSVPYSSLRDQRTPEQVVELQAAAEAKRERKNRARQLNHK